MASNGRRVPVPFRMRVMKKIGVTIRLFFLFCLALYPLLTSTLESSPLVTIAAEDLTVTGRFDVCGPEEFPCGNTSICLDRSLHCDGIQHCDGNEDEEGCADAYGSLSSLVKGMPKHEELEDVVFDTSFDNCSLMNVPESCDCRFFTFLYCQNENITAVPRGVRGPLTKMVLTNNSLSSFPRGAFSEYHGLKIIHVEGNVIPVLTPGPFLGLRNVTFLLLMKNQIKVIEPKTFKGLENLQWLLMQCNLLRELNMEVLEDLPSLEVLDLAENKLTALGTFPTLNRLFWLGLGKNFLERIEKSTFEYLTALEVLILKNNLIYDIEETAFSTLVKLLELDISHNRLKYLKPKIFWNLKNLNKLNLEFNMISSFPSDIFRGCYSLKSLDLQGLEINNIDIKLFHRLSDLEFIYFKKFLYCSYAPYVRICYPKTDGLSSTEHLLVWPALRMSVWIVALMTCAGNTVVLTWRVLSRKEDRVLSLFIKNLAFADLLMGIYLVAVGAQDMSFRDKYNKYAHAWLSSWHCTACGIIAMVSSEVSVLILSLITLERYRCIRTNVRVVTLSGARYSLAAVWIIGFVLAIIPILKYSHEQGFYSSNGLCIPLHISDPFSFGWEYSAFVFFGINFSAVRKFQVQLPHLLHRASRRPKADL
ncbi:relaxin receptor 1-like isoform X2 [Stegodyphus dumicola]|uniref:relaxin receptor 1-like isoform X2 n=1 Tax=Stegodyphus dumicola TaxID=202533 RepID=UPI0015A79A74|nr:relaxin receptor 1-like isoform X2 [Stegodyphus dumicola]